MAENNWLLQDGRSILVEFDAAAAAKAWGWFGNRSSGEGLEFDAAAAEWANHAWLRGGQMVQAAEAGGTQNIVDAGNIASTEVLGAALISPAIATAGIITAEAHGNTTLSAVLSAAGIDTVEAHGSPIIAAAVSSAGITSAEAFGQPVVTPEVATQNIVDAGAIAGAEAFGVAAFAAGIDASGIVTVEAFGQPLVYEPGLAQNIVDAGNIASAEIVPAPQMSWVPVVIAGGGSGYWAPPPAPIVAHQLTVAGIASAEKFGLPSIVLGQRSRGTRRREAELLLLLAA